MFCSFTVVRLFTVMNPHVLKRVRTQTRSATASTARAVTQYFKPTIFLM